MPEPVNAGVKFGHGAAQKSTTFSVEEGRRQEGQRPVSCAHSSLASDLQLWPTRPMKRGDRGRSRTMGRIEHGGGNGGEPVRSPSGQNEISLAVWLILVSRNVIERAG